MIYRSENRVKQDYLKEKKEDNDSEIKECNELRKKINKAALIGIGISAILILPAFLYYIDIIPATVSFYPLVMSALVGCCLGAISTIPTIIGNIGISILKSILNSSNKKIEKELKQLNNTKESSIRKNSKSTNVPVTTKQQNNYKYQYNFNHTSTNVKNSGIKIKKLKK